MKLADEEPKKSNSGKVGEHGIQMQCQHCLDYEHNKRSCPKIKEPPAPRAPSV
ncbi:hypothetical protein JCGZ_17458 [Jatropha curcas]|uniref:Uncharacterized protein n=1 Tax=Jatropha curcas TaxID=180498 RepID=A0A067L9J1_JATCU|nr:hypothetical protein JCGZ_17458 [Jatropha curcas]